MMMLTRTCALTFLLSGLALTALVSCSEIKLPAVMERIPKDVNGWKPSEESSYNRGTLFQYINGGAELYLAYSFREVTARTYAKPGQPLIVVDIYDMETTEDAFGVFTSERGGNDIGIGQGSDDSGGLLRFFKGRFFVSVLPFEQTKESQAAALELARAVADAIPRAGRMPEIVSMMPRDGLVEHSLRYFHTHTILNHLYFVAEQNILQLGPDTEAVLARYELAGAKPYMLLVHYPSADRAEAAAASFGTAYMPEAAGKGAVRTEDGTWTVARAQGEFLLAVFDAADEEQARALMDTVAPDRR